jgi:hypothetical protein
MRYWWMPTSPTNKGLDFVMTAILATHAPVVVVTPANDPRYAVEIMRSGAFDYIVKAEGWMDLVPQALKDALRQCDDLHERERSITPLKRRVEQLRRALAAGSAGSPAPPRALCRDLLAALGAPVLTHDARTGGFKVVGMGAVLDHPAFRKGVPQDTRFHLKALYSDPRGINLRNHLAHGMAHIGMLGVGVANWVVHSLVLLSILRLKQGSAEG